MSPLEERAVVPFYLQMMGLNARQNAAEIWPELVAAGQTVALDDATWLLGAGDRNWRPVVMGAWFSTGFDAAHVGQPLRDALTTSYGTFTAPPLVVACALVLGAEALDLLTDYAERAPGRDVSAGFVAAAIEHVGGSPAVEVPDQDRLAFTELLAVATRLRSALR